MLNLAFYAGANRVHRHALAQATAAQILPSRQSLFVKKADLYFMMNLLESLNKILRNEMLEANAWITIGVNIIKVRV